MRAQLVHGGAALSVCLHVLHTPTGMNDVEMELAVASPHVTVDQVAEALEDAARAVRRGHSHWTTWGWPG